VRSTTCTRLLGLAAGIAATSGAVHAHAQVAPGGAEPAGGGPPALALEVSSPAPGSGADAAPSAPGPTRDAASDAHDLVWNPDWPTFREGEFIFTGLALATAIGSLAIPDGDGRWTSRNSLDESGRDAFRLEAKSARDKARDASDVLLIALTNQLAVDAVAVTWWGFDRPAVTWQLVLIDIETLSVNAALSGLVSGLTSRERPYVAEQCARRPPEEQTDECVGKRRHRSFFSGHSSTSFAAAGLMCMHHAHLPLYGGGAADAIACGASLAAAATVGTMRVLSDQHWVSDVVVGATVGTTVGFGLPYLLHYRGGALPQVSDDAGGVSVQLVPGPTGGVLTGTF
jgi:membrane-associated phospholipid phosphatase